MQLITDALYSAVIFDSYKQLKLLEGMQEIRDSEQVKKAILAEKGCLQWEQLEQSMFLFQ